MKRLLILAGLAFPVAPVHSHQINTSYTRVTVRPDTVKLLLAIDEADLLKHFGLDQNNDEILWRDEALEGASQVLARLEGKLSLAVDGRPAALEQRAADVGWDGEGNLFLNLFFIAPVRGMPAELELQLDFFGDLGEAHKNLARVMAPGKPLQQAIFSREQTRHRFVVGEPVSLLEQVGQFIWLGVEHIFLGYDHIAFLLALIIAGGRLVSLIKIVTAFTVAHSITLILAALEVVTLPSRLIESGIALSIVYVAGENFWLHRTDYRWLLSFCFGLVHGFGFANVLRDLGLPTRGLVESLLAFNAGVELGQVCIVAVIFPLTLWVGRSHFHRRVVWGVSGLILLLGLGWLVERIFELSYMPI